jgi:hypothetical protein
MGKNNCFCGTKQLPSDTINYRKHDTIAVKCVPVCTRQLFSSINNLQLEGTTRNARDRRESWAIECVNTGFVGYEGVFGFEGYQTVLTHPSDRDTFEVG